MDYRKVSDFTNCEGVVTWAGESDVEKTQDLARCYSLAITRIAEGFLPGIGVENQSSPVSFVMDNLGVYYDASTPSQLEALIKVELTEAQRTRANALISAWQTYRLSKYNNARDYQGKLPANYVLVVDQCRDDFSVEYGLAKASSFNDMLDAALADNPECQILIKLFPHTKNTRKQGYFDKGILKKNPRIDLLAEDIHPVSLIEHAQAVYCVTSQIGFEGLLWGKPVHTFGMPFYAGWELTQDELESPAWRLQPVALENLVYAALITYSRYLDPQTEQPCQVEELISCLGLQRQTWERFPAILYAYGFTQYKEQFIRGFFQGSQIYFVKHLHQIPKDATLLVWGNNNLDMPSLPEIKLLRVEDGFLRSVGLGAEYRIRPLSWAVDSRGIYYDATKASDLEQLLQTTKFSKDLLSRAKALREQIIKHNLTKYNVGASSQKTFLNKDDISGRKIILVPGQVETDASIAFGAPNIRHNMALLRAVRAANPEAFLIYKPHPDVVAGLRYKGNDENLAESWCDQIVTDRAMGELLAEVDEVHVLTSLAGFEALMRGKHVTCYGQPFYAGWGLTIDKAPIERRTRRLTLDELVAGALILYPLYLSFSGNRLISAEQAVDELLAWKTKQATQPLTLFQKLMRYIHKITKKK